MKEVTQWGDPFVRFNEAQHIVHFFYFLPRLSSTGQLHLISFSIRFFAEFVNWLCTQVRAYRFDCSWSFSTPIALRHLAPLSEIHMHPYFLLHKCISVPIPVICTIGVLLDHLKGLDGSHLPLGRACPLNFGLAQVYNILKHHFNLSQMHWARLECSEPLPHQLDIPRVL